LIKQISPRHAPSGGVPFQRQLIKAEDLPNIVSLTYFMEHGTDIKGRLRFSRKSGAQHQPANHSDHRRRSPPQTLDRAGAVPQRLGLSAAAQSYRS
jgi:hypothetical protein